MRRVVVAAALAAALVALMAATPAAALHEDEAGLYDWHVAGVGPAALAAFQPSSKRLKAVHVASTRNVVASFGLKKGDLRWRHVLGADDNVTCLAAATPSVLAGTAAGAVMAFDPATGKVLRTLATAARVVGCAVAGNEFVVALATAEKVVQVTLPVEPKSMPIEIELQSATAVDGLAQHAATVVSAAVAPKYVAALTKAGKLALGAKTVNAPAAATRVTSACEAGFSLDSGDFVTVGADNSMTVVPPKQASSLDLGCGVRAAKVPAALQNALSVSDNGFLQLSADEPTGLRERPGTPIRVLASRFDAEHSWVDVLVASSSGAFQCLRLKADADDEKTARIVPTPWTTEGGLADLAHATFTTRRGDLVPEIASREFKFGLNDRVVGLSRGGMLFSVRTSSADANGTAPEWAAFAAGDAVTANKQELSGAAFETLGLRDQGDIIVARLRFADAKRTVVELSYDVFTGRLVSEAHAPAAKVVAVLEDGAVIDSEGAVSGSAVPRAREYHVVDKAAGVVTGYTVPAGELKATRQWSVQLGAPIVSSAFGGSDPRLSSSVEHLRYVPNATSGAKDIRLKYPTANVLALAYFAADSSDAEMQTLTVIAIDTVNGQVLATMRHPDAAGKVPIAIVNHVIVYHFLSVESMRYMVGAWELFEHQSVVMQDSQYTSPAMVVMSFFEKRREFSAPAARPPHVTPQLLAFPHGDVAAIGVSTTQQGIARKIVLFATTEGSVISVPLSMLLAGGIPETPLPGQQKAPPKATVLMPPTAYLTHRNRVARADAVVTAPTPLESTSHVLVFGVDLFYVRASSGKPFDMIDEEFNRAVLIAGCVALPAAILVARFIAQRRALSLAWA